MPDTFTKDEAENLKRAAQDIELFIRLAVMRIESNPDVLPFKPTTGRLVLSWLRPLAAAYGNGDDISKT